MSEKRILNRRQVIKAGLLGAGGLAFAGCRTAMPPTYGNILRMGDNFTYALHRGLFSEKGLAPEYSRSEITSFPATGAANPADRGKREFSEEYAKLHSGQFKDYRLQIDGLVENRRNFSLEELRQMAQKTQITRHICEEGWSAIAEWTGVQLRTVLETCKVHPEARYVRVDTFDDSSDSYDMVDALHPQTILATGMNGGELPVAHGAPLRLRVERQIGYKSLKFVSKITVLKEFDDCGSKGAIQTGWAWYVGM